MAKAIFDGFSHNEMALDPYSHNPDISENVQQVTAMLQAWNEALQTFKFVRMDNVGRLLVSFSPPSAPHVSQTNPAVGIVPTLVLPANVNRRYFIIYHSGTQAAWVTYDSTLPDANGITLTPGSTFDDDLWTGDVFMKSQTGLATSVTIWEY